MNPMDTLDFLRIKARQCRDLSGRPDRVDSQDLIRIADELEAKAVELESSLRTLLQLPLSGGAAGPH